MQCTLNPRTYRVTHTTTVVQGAGGGRGGVVDGTPRGFVLLKQSKKIYVDEIALNSPEHALQADSIFVGNDVI